MFVVTILMALGLVSGTFQGMEPHKNESLHQQTQVTFREWFTINDLIKCYKDPMLVGRLKNMQNKFEHKKKPGLSEESEKKLVLNTSEKPKKSALYEEFRKNTKLIQYFQKLQSEQKDEFPIVNAVRLINVFEFFLNLDDRQDFPLLGLPKTFKSNLEARRSATRSLEKLGLTKAVYYRIMNNLLRVDDGFTAMKCDEMEEKCPQFREESHGTGCAVCARIILDPKYKDSELTHVLEVVLKNLLLLTDWGLQPRVPEQNETWPGQAS